MLYKLGQILAIMTLFLLSSACSTSQPPPTNVPIAPNGSGGSSTVSASPQFQTVVVIVTATIAPTPTSVFVATAFPGCELGLDQKELTPTIKTGRYIDLTFGEPFIHSANPQTLFVFLQTKGSWDIYMCKQGMWQRPGKLDYFEFAWVKIDDMHFRVAPLSSKTN